MRRFLRNNGLSLTLFGLFVVFGVGQVMTGIREYNDDRQQQGEPPVGYRAYLQTGAFLEATMENWESEFLQMSAYVVLTTFLYQKGSAESKDPNANGERRPARSSATSGRLRRVLYENSLSLALLSLFVVSFALHAVGGAAAYSEERMALGQPAIGALAYLTTSRFWFESFQNWQSEFLSIGVMVVFTVFLRQKGSPESKSIDAPDSQTG
jgi:hypothetical protein